MGGESWELKGEDRGGSERRRHGEAGEARTELNALVKRDVVDLNAAAGSPRGVLRGLLRLGLVVEQQLVVEAELALGRAREVALDHCTRRRDPSARGTSAASLATDERRTSAVGLPERRHLGPMLRAGDPAAGWDPLAGWDPPWRLLMQPLTSLRRMVPLFETIRLQFSTTSMKSSFFLYLMPSLRQLIAPVACSGSTRQRSTRQRSTRQRSAAGEHSETATAAATALGNSTRQQQHSA